MNKNLRNISFILLFLNLIIGGTFTGFLFYKNLNKIKSIAVKPLLKSTIVASPEVLGNSIETLVELREKERVEKIQKETEDKIKDLQAKLSAQEALQAIERKKSSIESIYYSGYPLEMYIFDPPSNFRETPDGKIICEVAQPQYFYSYGEIDNNWHVGFLCNSMGVMHSSQLTY